MYVSQNGNDATGTVYNSASFSDPFKPTSPNTFKTYAAAFTHMRNGYPDWILFKRGDTFIEMPLGGTTYGTSLRSGRSRTEPSLLGAYGAGELPLMKMGILTPGFNICSTNDPLSQIKYIAIVGIHCYGYTRDPTSIDFVLNNDNVWGQGTSGLVSIYGHNISSILLEGCKVVYCKGGIGVQADSSTTPQTRPSIEIRRNILVHNYDGQGMSA